MDRRTDGWTNERTGRTDDGPGVRATTTVLPLACCATASTSLSWFIGKERFVRSLPSEDAVLPSKKKPARATSAAEDGRPATEAPAPSRPDAAPAPADTEDYFVISGRYVIFHHVKERSTMFEPDYSWKSVIRHKRNTFGTYRKSAQIFVAHDSHQHIFVEVMDSFT